MSRPVRALLTSVALSMTACVPLMGDDLDRRELFSPLFERDLSRFEHRLSSEEHAGIDDAWTDLGRAFVALTSCDALPPATERIEEDPDVLLLYYLALLEDQRRLRLVAASLNGGPRQWHRGTIHTQLASRTYFSREAAEVETDMIYWPPTRATREEVWPDEFPAPSEVPYACETLPERLAEAPLTDYMREWRILGAALGVMEAEPVQPALQPVAELLRLHRADLALLLMNLPFEIQEADEERIQVMARQALDWLHEAPPSPEARLAYNLRLARLAMIFDENEIARQALGNLRDHPLQEVAETAVYLRTRLAWLDGLWEEAAAELNPPRRPSPLHNAHIYFVASANRYLGHTDVFLGMAREALSDRARPNDPFLGALYREVLEELARFEVDERTFELLEELGPRSALPERQRELAEVALDLGRPRVARELAEPLLEDQRDARRRPRIHAVLALAAFQLDEPRRFQEHLDAISRRPETLQAAIPRQRQARFFAHQDIELSRVLRTMLPLMAEWGDDAAARSLREQWLTRIVEHIQRFLRDAPESAVSDDLTELYTLASQLLEDHPRGYASRVGDGSSRAALVLGTVSVATMPPVEDTPAPRLTWGPLPSLLRFPLDPIPATRFSPTLRPQGGDS